MSPALALAPRLAVERLRGTRGGAILDVLAVLAFTVSALLTLTVAGGTWMFVQRWRQPTEQIHTALQLDAATAEPLLEAYLVLAAVACALLVVPVLNLGAAAARLGARGRARRLASLRLIGMSSAQVVTISVVETLVQAAAGTLLGLGLWLVGLPVWQAVAFQGQHIGPGELLLPWWLLLAVVVALLVLAAASTAVGLQRVRISPLGVAAQQTPRALRAWRLVAFLAAVIAFVVFGQLFAPHVMNVQLLVYAVVVAMILLVVAAVNLLGPWVLQLLARPAAVTGTVPRLIAMRRIIDDPRAAWRNVSGVAMLGMVSAFVALLPTDPQFFGDDAGNLILARDLRTGVIITLAVGLVVAATSTLINQAALVLDRAAESIALDAAGFPRRLFAATRRRHVLMPLAVTLTVSVGVGLVLATPFLTVFRFEPSGVLLVAATVVAGLLLTLAAAEACRPLQRTVLDQTHRRND